MKIKVSGISKQDSAISAYFNCSVGSASALWNNECPPIAGHEYDIEFDIGATLERSLNAFTSEVHRYYVKSSDDEVEFNGVVESVDDDGMTYFRLADDCLIMIESKKGSISSGEWLNVRLKLKDVEIYAQGI